MAPAIGNLNPASLRIEEVRVGSASRALIGGISCVALGAALYTLASSPFDYSILGWVALTPLFIAIHRKSFARSMMYGLLYGILICAGVAHWMYVAINSYFVALFPLDLILTVLAFTVFVGMYTAITAGAWSILMRSKSAMRVLAIAALWVLCEFARSTLLSGFSWGLLGYTQYGFPVVTQIADVTGVYGVSFLLACSSYCAAELYLFLTGHTDQPRRLIFPLGFTAVTTLSIIGYGAVRIHQYDPAMLRDPAPTRLRVTMVEHDMPAQDRWSRIKYLNSLLAYSQLTRSRVPRDSTDLVIWPEFAGGLYLEQDPSMRLELSRLVRSLDTPLLLGAPRMTETDRYNSAYLLSSDGAIVETYDKMRLLPFAEYHPIGMPSFIRRDTDMPQEFTAGTRATVFAIPKAKFGVTICYEGTYPEYARELTRHGAQFLVNISNDVWLTGVGGKAAADQHFAMAAFRAIENRRAIARATMAGVTGFIDELGRPVVSTQGSDTVTSGTVPLRDQMTIYTRFGDWFVVLCAIVAGLCLIATIWKFGSDELT